MWYIVSYQKTVVCEVWTVLNNKEFFVVAADALPDVFKKVLGSWDDRRVKFLNSQDCDEIEEGVRLINELKEYANTFKRREIDISKLKIGLKCGGSDGYSGITANPLVGRLHLDKLSPKSKNTFFNSLALPALLT